MVATKNASSNKQRAKELKREKQLLKSAKKLNKANGDEEDIVTIMESLNQENSGDAVSQQAFSNTPPKPRTSFTFIHTKLGFILFGGEHYDARVCKVFRDCYKWNPEKIEDGSCWKSAVGGISPNPRVGHASCLFNDEIYIHGGEFATNSQFYHYKDLWKLEIKSLKWQSISPVGVAPTPRSGHKMVMCRNLLLTFGGFHDNGREVRYFNDLYAFAPTGALWKKLTPKNPPSVRSAAIVAATNDFLVVSGGFSKTRDTDRDCKGTFHEDIWALDLRPLFDNPDDDLLQWTKCKRRALTRSGVAYSQHKNLVYAFGGVVDNDAGGNSYNSSFFYNDVWQLDLISKQWVRLRIGGDTRDNSITAPQLTYRPRKNHLESIMLDVDAMKRIVKEAESKKDNEVSKNRACDLKLKDAGVSSASESDKTHNLQLNCNPKELSAPLPRSNSAVAVKDGWLYMYGGGLELSGNRMLLFDDAWRLHLKNLVWELISPGGYSSNVLIENTIEESSESSSGEDDESLIDSDTESLEGSSYETGEESTES